MAEFYTDTLANGLRLITVEMPHLHSVELSCSFGVGSRHEPMQLAGISHFLSTCCFAAAANTLQPELENRFEAIGGNINAGTDAETTCFHSRLHPDFVADGLQLLASTCCSAPAARSTSNAKSSLKRPRKIS
ncbi:MAG: insulinase family protein [Syntrophotaleaceae bacterium]